LKYYDQEGKELGFIEWAVRMNDDQEVCLACDTVGEFTLSTIWIGMDMNYHPTDQILIFESMMILDGEPIDCVRWETKEMALEGHRRTVEEMHALGCGVIFDIKDNTK
jgi:hypothetical protein